jgi:hypothetical protein
MICFRFADVQNFSYLLGIKKCVDPQDFFLKLLILVLFDLLFNSFGLVDLLLNDLNIGIFLHLNSKEDSLFLDPIDRIYSYG